MRKNPELTEIARIIEDPVTHALIRILITYEKYNFESEEAAMKRVVNFENESNGELKDPDAVPYNEIELMKELVQEFTTAIDERIREEGSPELEENGSPT